MAWCRQGGMVDVESETLSRTSTCKKWGLGHGSTDRSIRHDISRHCLQDMSVISRWWRCTQSGQLSGGGGQLGIYQYRHSEPGSISRSAEEDFSGFTTAFDTGSGPKQFMCMQ